METAEFPGRFQQPWGGAAPLCDVVQVKDPAQLLGDAASQKDGQTDGEVL